MASEEAKLADNLGLLEKASSGKSGQVLPKLAPCQTPDGRMKSDCERYSGSDSISHTNFAVLGTSVGLGMKL